VRWCFSRVDLVDLVDLVGLMAQVSLRHQQNRY